MALLEVDRDTCTKCGICAEVCPTGLIYYREGKYPRMLPGTDDFCTRCGHCVTACPVSSLRHADIPLEQCAEIDAVQKANLEQVGQLIKSRRSIRKYRDKYIPHDTIEKLIDIARYAPTGHNDQAVRWLVIDDRDTLKKIEAAGVDWMREMVNSSPHMAKMFSGFLKRMESGFPGFIRDAPAVVATYSEKDIPIRVVDCALALGYFDLAASAMGLGCCWAGFFMGAANTFQPLKEIILLPEGYQVYGALMVGYSEYKYQRIPVRKPPDITWH